MIAPSGSVIDSSLDCSCVDIILVEALINSLLMSGLTLIVNKIRPSGCGVDSSQDCSPLDCVLFEIYNGQVVPGFLQFWMKF